MAVVGPGLAQLLVPALGELADRPVRRVDDYGRDLVGIGIGGRSTVLESALEAVLPGGDRNSDGRATV